MSSNTHQLAAMHFERTADAKGWDIKVAYTWGNNAWTAFQIHYPEIPKYDDFFNRLYKNINAARIKSEADALPYFPNMFNNRSYERYTY